MSNEFDFNSGGAEGSGQGGAEQAEESSAEMSELALGPEKSNAGRNAAMILLTFALVGAGTIYFMRVKSGPQGAQAAPPAEVKKATNTLLDFIKNGDSKMKGFRDLLKGTEEIVKAFKKYETPVQVASEDLFRKGNPFQHKQPDAEDIEKIKKEKEEQAKRAAEIARRKAYEDAEVDIKKIKVSFIMGGARGRTCMINSNVYKVGGKVEDFEITDIQPNSVTFVRKIPGYDDFKRTVTAGK